MSETWCKDIEKRMDGLEAKVDLLIKTSGNLEMVFKWVVTPLLVIVGALAGINLVQ